MEHMSQDPQTAAGGPQCTTVPTTVPEQPEPLVEEPVTTSAATPASSSSTTVLGMLKELQDKGALSGQEAPSFEHLSFGDFTTPEVLAKIEQNSNVFKTSGNRTSAANSPRGTGESDQKAAEAPFTGTGLPLVEICIGQLPYFLSETTLYSFISYICPDIIIHRCVVGRRNGASQGLCFVMLEDDGSTPEKLLSYHHRTWFAEDQNSVVLAINKAAKGSLTTSISARVRQLDAVGVPRGRALPMAPVTIEWSRNARHGRRPEAHILPAHQHLHKTAGSPLFAAYGSPQTPHMSFPGSPLMGTPHAPHGNMWGAYMSPPPPFALCPPHLVPGMYAAQLAAMSPPLAHSPRVKRRTGTGLADPCYAALQSTAKPMPFAYVPVSEALEGVDPTSEWVGTALSILDE